jgi:hypothetical protein
MASTDETPAATEALTPGGDAKNNEVVSDGPIDFDVNVLLGHFQKCYGEDGSALSIDSYILGYEEVVKFLNLLGTVFGWVASDVVAKLGILSGHRADEERSAHFVDIQTMCEYEVKEDLIKFKAKDSSTGSRNLLRLHRALEYINGFLRKLPDLASDEKCCPASQTAYKDTLMKFHPWVVQKGALMAMHMLPTRDGLIQKICHNDEEKYQMALDVLPQAVEAAQKVYDKTQEVYKKHGLLDLP